MGCLGKEEIRALVLPMISQSNHFENLAVTSRGIPASDSENYPFGLRVWGVLCDIYTERMIGKEGVSAKVLELFGHTTSLKQTPPAPVAPPVPTAHAVPTTPDQPADLSTIRNLSFLVVDDSDRIRQMTVKVLNDAGVTRILESCDGAEAWEILKKSPSVDVVLSDWIMPKLTGIELVQRVMQVESLARNITFLMLTSVDSKASIVEALSVGVRGYLIKPFSRKQLLEKVYFATEWLRKEQQSDKKKC
ncbi:MAG: response regulator [SAR324 cluster bacterium]|nr:response regulator [SAR324 cluster bacterium]